MKERCKACNKRFRNLLLHHMKSSCGDIPSEDKAAAIPLAASLHSNPSESTDSPNFDFSLHALAEDGLDIPILEYQNEKQSQIGSFEGMTGYFLRKRKVVDNICQPIEPIETAYESRLQEFIFEGIEDEIDANHLLDDIHPENESTMNVGPYDSDDHFTVSTETPFFLCLNLHWI